MTNLKKVYIIYLEHKIYNLLLSMCMKLRMLDKCKECKNSCKVYGIKGAVMGYCPDFNPKGGVYDRRVIARNNNTMASVVKRRVG